MRIGFLRASVMGFELHAVKVLADSVNPLKTHGI